MDNTPFGYQHPIPVPELQDSGYVDFANRLVDYHYLRGYDDCYSSGTVVTCSPVNHDVLTDEVWISGASPDPTFKGRPGFNALLSAFEELYREEVHQAFQAKLQEYRNSLQCAGIKNSDAAWALLREAQTEVHILPAAIATLGRAKLANAMDDSGQ